MRDTTVRYWRALANSYRPDRAGREDFEALRDVVMQAREQILACLPSSSARALFEVVAGHASSAAQDAGIARLNAATAGRRNVHPARDIANRIIARSVEAERARQASPNDSAIVPSVRATLRSAKVAPLPSERTVRAWIKAYRAASG